MTPRKRVHSETPASAQAPDDNVRRRKVTAEAPRATPRKRKLILDRPDVTETSQADQVTVKRPRCNRVIGKLAGLMEVPMDILFEVFGHLMPLDVLRLARTTKQFRRMLMHSSSVSIWIAARKNVPNLPDCPPFMSEPQFANLVFDTHCHECLAPHIRSIEWRIGRRICAKCAKFCMIEDYPILVGESVYKCVPSKYGKRGRPSYYSKDIQEFQSKKAALADSEERDKFVKDRQALVVLMEKHGALLEAWAANQAKDRSDQLDDLRRERKEAIIQKLTELGWGPEIEQIPSRDDLSLHRLVKQPIRLTHRIWTNIRAEMVDYMQQMKTQRLDRERKALVISRKRIAVSILRAHKISRLPLTDVMPEPMDFCAIPEVLEILELPTETEVTEDTFVTVVERMDELISEWRTRILGSIVHKVKESLYSHLFRPHRQGKIADFTSANNLASSPADPPGKGKAKAVGPPILDDSQIIQNLSLATTVFNCKNCNPRSGIPYDPYNVDFGSDTDSGWSEDDFFDPWSFSFRHSRSRFNPLFFPKVMGHHCLTKQHEFSWDHSSGDPTKQYDYPLGKRTCWSGDPLQVDEKASKMAANVIARCGMDPETTTTAEMDESDFQLACPECLDWSNEVRDEAEASVFDWRSAVTHNSRVHPSKTNIEWELIDDELRPNIVNIDEEYKADLGLFSTLVMHDFVGDMFNASEEMVWLCAHCLDLPCEAEGLGLSKMKNHLSSSHSVSEPQENQDYYKDYEAPQGRQTRIPCLKVTLSRVRPEDVPGLGEKHAFDSWCMACPEDGLEDEIYDDYYL